MKQSDKEFQICRQVIEALIKNYPNKNYLFLEPVDTAYFPTYTTIVKRPMDLGTVESNLNSGYYETKESFFRDASLCFENATIFHKDKPENAWIIKFAKDMQKYLNKERKRAEKKAASESAAAGHGHGKAQGQGHSSAAAGAPMGAGAASTKVKAADGSGSAISSASSEQKKPKIKLSIGKKKNAAGTSKSSSSAAASTAVASASASTTTPTLKIGMKKSKTASAGASSSSTTKPTPKVKLSLSIKQPSKTTASESTSATKSSVKSTSAPASSSAPIELGTSTPKASASSTKIKKPSFKLKLSAKKASAAATTQKANNASATPTAAVSSEGGPTPTPTPTNKKSSTKKEDKKRTTPKLSTASAPSRGKELPTQVAEAQAAKKKEQKKAANEKKAAAAAASANKSSAKSSASSSKASSTTKAAAGTKSKESNKKIRLSLSSSSSTSPILSSNGTMTPEWKAQCYKVLSALKRKEYVEIGWFLKPVNDSRMIDDYRAKIPSPMDLGTMTNKLDKNAYGKVSEFVHDLRRIFGNCLRFNNTDGDSFRPVAKSMTDTSIGLMTIFFPRTKKPVYPSLLYCWRECFDILDAALTLKNPDDGYPTVHYFLHPVSFYFGGTLPQDYAEKVKKPMDFGTITSNLFEGIYQSVQEFVDDCRLVTANCKAYYDGRNDGVMFVGQAARLEEFLSGRLSAILNYDASPQGAEGRKAALGPPPIELSRVPTKMMLALLDSLRNATYTDKATKLTEPAARQFEVPVDVSYFPDYLQFVPNPMDIQTVEKNIQAGKYTYPEDFEYDVNLIFKNCEAYNIPKRNDHIVNLARYCAKTFRKLYASRIRAFEASGGKVLHGEDKKEKKRPSSAVSSSTSAPPSKKSRKSPVNGESVSSQLSAAPAAKAPTPKSFTSQPKSKAKPKKNAKTLPRIILRTDGPLPLHVAIAKIKQEFTTRRPHKDLFSWEGACSRFYRELKRHPWISTSKRFVFDAPVPMLHPEIKEAYAAKIRNPMDLTTAECKLLQGGMYQGPQEFVDDIALVFANAVTFNKAGHEQGDPTSCAYFDASRHLLRYTRWLSLEVISQFLIDDSHSEGATQTGPIPQWKLTTSNQRDGRKEMDEIVMKQYLDSDGDRYTWAECEKLLKSLRHQSDMKRMSFFLQPNYPADYFAYIAKPMSWETCHRRLQDRKYETFGEVVSDLRLIFSNALKYNGRMKDVDPISKTAYDSAVTMSGKLEVAIQRMLVTVADRIEREKVEDIVLGREQEIARKDEEERLKKEWQEERERGAMSGSTAQRVSTANQTVKIIRRPVKRGLDFEFPFQDEETPYQQSEMDVLDKQKMMFEKQQKGRTMMSQTSANIGFQVYDKLMERSRAIIWAKKLTEKIQIRSQNPNINLTMNEVGKTQADAASNPKVVPPSMVGSFLGKSDRKQVKLAITTRTKLTKKKKKVKARLFLE